MSARKAHMALVVDGKAQPEAVACGWPRVGPRTLVVDDPAKVTCKDCLRALGRERVHYRLDNGEDAC